MSQPTTKTRATATKGKNKGTKKYTVNKAQKGAMNALEGDETTYKEKVYERITQKVLDQMEKGIVPWQKPWNVLADGSVEVPTNYVSKKPYTGINTMLLACNEHERPYYMTYKQAESLGGQVRKGAKGEIVLFYKFKDKGEEGNEKKFFMEKPSFVFNIADIDGIEFKLPEVAHRPETSPGLQIPIGETVANGYLENGGPKLIFASPDSACYMGGSKDTINMPRLEAFKSPEQYYKTLFHECVHSTGHSSRLNREEIQGGAKKGSVRYSREELTAEMGANFLAAHCGFNMEQDSDLLEQTATYITGYLQVFKMDKKVFYTAARNAQKAANYILGAGTEGKEKIGDAE